jgi:Arc/MetJ-type ribon-helix-helix transcriptional regulator
MTKSITVRVPSDRVAQIDALVESGDHPSRTSVIIAAIDRLIAELERERIDRAIVEGYTRIPQTAEELEWADVAGRRSVADEPW